MIEKNTQIKMNWIHEYKRQLETEEKARAQELGFKELLQLEVGETTITIDADTEPRETETRYGKRLVLTLKEPADKEFMINPMSPLWKELLYKLGSGETTVTIVRSGRGKQTRYALK
jgi:hypothetical protein